MFQQLENSIVTQPSTHTAAEALYRGVGVALANGEDVFAVRHHLARQTAALAAAVARAGRPAPVDVAPLNAEVQRLTAQLNAAVERQKAAVSAASAAADPMIAATETAATSDLASILAQVAAASGNPTALVTLGRQLQLSAAKRAASLVQSASAASAPQPPAAA